MLRNRLAVWVTLLVLVALAAIVFLQVNSDSLPVFSTDGDASIIGSVSYVENEALPPNALITIALVDASSGDTAAVIGERSFKAAGKVVPFPFQVKYASSAIDPGHRYLMRATVTLDGEVIFATDTKYPVITGGNPSTADLVLKKVPAPGG